MRRLHIALTLALAALALGGCGAAQPSSADDFEGAEKQVVQVVDDLSSEAVAGDADEICSRLLSKELADSLKAGNASCAEEVRDTISDSDGFELDVRDVTIAGTTARAEVRQDDENATFELTREGDDWRLSSFG